MLVTQSHCSLTPHFGPFLSEEKKNRKKRNFFSATVQGLRGEPVMSSISAKFSTFPGFPSINPGFSSFSQSEDDNGEITKIP